MSEVFTVFYCWQSDSNQNHTRRLIRDALEVAADRITIDKAVPYRIAVHSDTENEPGLCNIPETILRRLREADAIVSDLTFVAVTNCEKKHCSNPNVLFELGYAFHAIGPERLICVLNERYGESSKQIFDLAHHRRPIAYTSPCEGKTRSETVESLAVQLETALRDVIRLGLSGGSGGDNEIRHQRDLSEIENYWHSLARRNDRLSLVSMNFSPKLYREKRWPDVEIIENKPRQLGVRYEQRYRYPLQQVGNAPMNWGLYNDTYGDPWSLTYSGQFWTEVEVASYDAIKLSGRDISLSPEPPTSGIVEAGQGIPMMQALPKVRVAFQFMASLCTEFAETEIVQWSFEGQNLDGRWLIFPLRDARGPGKARDIRRKGEIQVSEFKSIWRDIYAKVAKDFCDLFCRDGRTVTLEELKEF